MRYLCVLLVVIGMPLHAGAQEHRRAATPPVGSLANLPLLSSIGLPPLTSQPSSLPGWERKQVPAWERPQMPAWERQGPPPWERGHVSQPIYPAKPVKPDHDRPRRKADVVFVPYPVYGYGYTSGLPYYNGPATVTPPAPAPAPPSDIGYLRLEVEPALLLQIYVDGVFIGTPADLGGELELRSGGHRIEMRAPGHESLTFDARIEADRGITYRGTLRAIDVQPAAPSAPIVVPAGSRTLYVIPGCYLGNVVPDAARLPAGCDISRMKTHNP